MKLLSFDGGVTMQGGLPIHVATPAHGTAFDIAGKNMTTISSTQNAFDIATTMAERRILKEACDDEDAVLAVPVKDGSLPRATLEDVTSCSQSVLALQNNLDCD